MDEAQKAREASFRNFAEGEPGLTVLTDHPIDKDEAWLDSFELRYRVGPVYDIIRHPETKMPTTIAIYGDWGMGKTSAMRWLDGALDRWNEHVDVLRSQQKKKRRKTGENPSGPEPVKVRPVWFYPWKYDTKEDVRRGLIAEVILNAIDVENASTKTVITAAKKFGLFLGKSFLHTLASMKLKAGVPGAGDVELDLAGIKEILAEYQQAAHPEKAYLNEFENTLRDWVRDTVGKDGKKERLVVFIDDLDRCMPEIALQVLEALKLYLNIDNLIFVVGVDKDVVDRLVVEHYRKLGLVQPLDQGKGDTEEDEERRKARAIQRQREEEKARNYLAKMFQVEVHVRPSEEQIERLLDNQLRDNPYWKQLTDDEAAIFRQLIKKEAKGNPREIKRLINSALMLSGEDQ